MHTLADIPDELAAVLDDDGRRLIILMTDPAFANVPNDRRGRCYDLACDQVRFNRGTHLVHGTICAPNQTVPLRHAWVVDEDGGATWEPGYDMWLANDEFTWLFGAVPRVTYTRREALELVHEHHHLGPWTGRDPDPDDDAYYVNHGRPEQPW